MEKVIPPRGPLSLKRMHSCFCEGLPQIKVSTKWQRVPVQGQHHVKELYQTLVLHPGIQIIHNAETTTNNEVPPFFCAVSCFLSLSLLLLSDPVYFSIFSSSASARSCSFNLAGKHLHFFLYSGEDSLSSLLQDDQVMVACDWPNLMLEAHQHALFCCCLQLSGHVQNMAMDLRSLMSVKGILLVVGKSWGSGKSRKKRYLHCSDSSFVKMSDLWLSSA